MGHGFHDVTAGAQKEEEESGLHLIRLVLGRFREAFGKAEEILLVLGANDLEPVVSELHREGAKVAEEAHHHAPLDPRCMHVELLGHQDEI